MNTRRVLFVLLLVPVTMAGGCRSTPKASPSPEFLPRADVKTPSDAWSEYQSARPARGATRTFTDAATRRRITVSVPSAWNGEAPVWRPGESKLDHVRVSYFTGTGPETEWSTQQQLDVHSVVRAEKIGNGYLLLVNHSGLKASILKLFIIDPERQSDAYFFLECRVAYDGERNAVWDACKGAVESATYETVR